MKGSGTCDDGKKEKIGGSDGNGKARKHGANVTSFVFVCLVVWANLIFEDYATLGWWCIYWEFES